MATQVLNGESLKEHHFLMRSFTTTTTTSSDEEGESDLNSSLSRSSSFESSESVESMASAPLIFLTTPKGDGPRLILDPTMEVRKASSGFSSASSSSSLDVDELEEKRLAKKLRFSNEFQVQAFASPSISDAHAAQMLRRGALGRRVRARKFIAFKDFAETQRGRELASQARPQIMMMSNGDARQQHRMWEAHNPRWRDVSREQPMTWGAHVTNPPSWGRDLVLTDDDRRFFTAPITIGPIIPGSQSPRARFMPRGSPSSFPSADFTHAASFPLTNGLSTDDEGLSSGLSDDRFFSSPLTNCAHFAQLARRGAWSK